MSRTWPWTNTLWFQIVRFGILSAVTLFTGIVASLCSGDAILLLAATLYPATLIVLLASILGHLASGRIAGFPFSFLTFLFVRIVRTPAGIRVGLNANRAVGSGAVWCTPVPSYDVLKRVAVFYLGEPVALTILGGTALALLLAIPPDRGAFHIIRMQHPYLSLLLFELAALGLCIGLAGLVPFRILGIPTAAARRADLRRGGRKAERWLAHITLTNAAMTGVRPRDWNQSWIDASLFEVPDASLEDAATAYMAYFWAIDRQKIDQAGAYLDRAYVSAGKINRLLMPFLVEAAFFEARFRGNVQLALELLQRANLRQFVEEADLLRATAAIECAQGQPAKAAQTAQEALRVTDRNLGLLPGINILEREWLVDLANPVDVA